MLQRGFPEAALFMVLLFSPILLLPANGQNNRQPEVIRIGIMASFYRDQPEEIVKTTVESLKELMLAQTGFNGDPIKVESHDALAEDLAKNKKQLGVFYGHEFAWIRKKHPGLRPLVLVVNQEQYQRAYLIVREDAKATGWEDLKRKSLAIALHTPEPCYLFLTRKCQATGMTPERFFSKIGQPANVEIALDDVVDGTVDTALIEEVALEAFKRRKPGRFARLRIAEKSAKFPAAVVAYQPEFWDKADLKTVRDSLLMAQQSPEGRQLLTLWKLTGFEQVPDDYDQSLTDILKAYPPPEKQKAK